MSEEQRLHAAEGAFLAEGGSVRVKQAVKCCKEWGWRRRIGESGWLWQDLSLRGSHARPCLAGGVKSRFRNLLGLGYACGRPSGRRTGTKTRSRPGEPEGITRDLRRGAVADRFEPLAQLHPSGEVVGAQPNLPYGDRAEVPALEAALQQRRRGEEGRPRAEGAGVDHEAFGLQSRASGVSGVLAHPREPTLAERCFPATPRRLLPPQGFDGF